MLTKNLNQDYCPDLYFGDFVIQKADWTILNIIKHTQQLQEQQINNVGMALKDSRNKRVPGP